MRELGTDHLDLWLVQVPDATTPMEETVDALRTRRMRVRQQLLAQRLFDVPGVSGVYFGHDFISVTKADGVNEWPQVKPAVLGAIMEHYMSGAPLLADGMEVAAATLEHGLLHVDVIRPEPQRRVQTISIKTAG